MGGFCGSLEDTMVYVQETLKGLEPGSPTTVNIQRCIFRGYIASLQYRTPMSDAPELEAVANATLS